MGLAKVAAVGLFCVFSLHIYPHIFYHLAVYAPLLAAFTKFRYRSDAIRAFSSLRLTLNWLVDWASDNSAKFGSAGAAVDKKWIFVGQLNADYVTKELLEFRFGKCIFDQHGWCSLRAHARAHVHFQFSILPQTDRLTRLICMCDLRLCTILASRTA